MKKKVAAVLLLLTSIACQAVRVADAEILFKGLDDVPLDSVCSATLEEEAPWGSEGTKNCKPSMAEYAGERLIHRGGRNDVIFSSVEYDPATRRVLDLTFAMSGESYDRVKQVLETKYGPPTKDGPLYWYGDNEGASFIYLTKAHDTTRITIITAAMRRARTAFEERQEHQRKERKANAVRGL